MLVDTNSEGFFSLYGLSIAFAFLYLPNQLPFIHFLEGMHYSLTLRYLLSSVFERNILIDVITPARTTDVESCHHVLPPDVTYHHFKGKPLWIGVFFKDFRDLAL